MLKDIRGGDLGFINKHLIDLKLLNEKIYKSRKRDKRLILNSEPNESKKKEIYKLYEYIFKSSFDAKKKEVLLTIAFGNEKWSWRVVGISFQALAEFEENNFKYKTRTFNRDHFYQPRIITFRKMLEKLMPYEEWWKWFWKNDETIIVTIEQHNNKNLMAENLDIIPIDWRLGYFTCNPVVGFSYTKIREGEYLRNLTEIILNRSGKYIY